VHGFTPGLSGLERGMDLAMASGEIAMHPSPFRLPLGTEPLFSMDLPEEISRPAVPGLPETLPTEPRPVAPEVHKEAPPSPEARIPSASLRRVGMSDPEKRECVRRAQAGDKTAVDQLLEADYRYIVKVARRFRVQGLELADLIQEGRMGYAHGVGKFSLEKSEREGTKVLTYLGWWVRQSITRYVADTLRTVRIPVHRQEMMRMVQRQIRELESKGEKFGLQEIAQNLDLEESQVSEALNLGRWDRERSLSHRVGEDATLLDFLPDAAPSPEQRVGDRLYQERLRHYLHQFGEKLSQTDRQNFESFLMNQGALSAPLLRKLQRHL